MTQYIPPAKLDSWCTPQYLFDSLNREFHFELDACATAENAKCKKYFSVQEDSLMQPWARSTFCNPPYGKPISKFVYKASQEAKSGKIVVMLLPARTDTEWFHRYCLNPRVELRFLKGRMHFNDGKGRSPFPSMVVIFR